MTVITPQIRASSAIVIPLADRLNSVLNTIGRFNDWQVNTERVDILIGCMIGKTLYVHDTIYQRIKKYLYLMPEIIQSKEFTDFQFPKDSDDKLIRLKWLPDKGGPQTAIFTPLEMAEFIYNLYLKDKEITGYFVNRMTGQAFYGNIKTKSY